MSTVGNLSHASPEKLISSCPFYPPVEKYVLRFPSKLFLRDYSSDGISVVSDLQHSKLLAECETALGFRPIDLKCNLTAEPEKKSFWKKKIF